MDSLPADHPQSEPRPRLRTVFFGTGDIARPAFEALRQRPDIELIGLVTQPDKPVGRHQVLTPPRIKEDALAHGIAVWQPERAREFIDALAALEADIYMVMAYGQILPQALIDLPRQVCWNLHASLLPRHRGASPIQAALWSGDSETGVTVMHIARALDAGDLVYAEKMPLLGQETGGELHDQLALLAPVAMNRALDLWMAGSAPRVPQNDALVTTLGKLERADGKINWAESARHIERKVRAFDPWPGTFTRLPDGRTLKIFPPLEIHPEVGAPGSVQHAVSGQVLVGCGEQSVKLSLVQPEGKRPMPAADFLRGYPLTVFASDA